MRVLAAETSTVAADGTASVTLGPVPVGHLWAVEILSVLLSTGTGTASIYSGDTPTAAGFIDGTYDGGRDSTARVGLLAQGESIHVEWTGATVGASATATIRGTLGRDRR